MTARRPDERAGCIFCFGKTPPPGGRCKACGRGAPIPEHACHARDCRVEVKPELLMCARHWRMVPRAIQRAVWRHYRKGQCDDKRVSREWLEAADAAIGTVAELEGKGASPKELLAMSRFAE